MIAFLGLFGGGNIGNDSTLQSMIYQLKRRLPDAKLLCISPDPFSAAELFNIPSVPMTPMFDRNFDDKGHVASIIGYLAKRILAEIKRFGVAVRTVREIDRLIIPGTGALDDFGVSPLGIPFTFFLWCFVARLFGVRVEFVSIGAGPIVHPLSRFFMVNALRLANYRSYRDVVSKDYLIDIGFNCESDLIYPDLAYSFPPEKIQDRRSAQVPPVIVGLGVMSYYGWRDDPVEGEGIFQEYIAKLSQFVIWLIEEGYSVRLLIGQGSDQRAVDDILLTVAQFDNTKMASIFTDTIETSEDLIYSISLTDIVIATRFHNVIFSLMLGRPVISTGYAGKFQALLKDVGLSGYSQKIEDLDVESLKNQFLSLVANYPEIQRIIENKNRQYRQQLDQQYDRLFVKLPESKPVNLQRSNIV